MINPTSEVLERSDPLDPLVVLMMHELHSHVPEDQRPVAMCDLSDEQAERARNAVLAMLPVAATLIRDQRATIERLSAELERVKRDLAAAPCQTKGNEDAESGCCGPCRARARRVSDG